MHPFDEYDEELMAKTKAEIAKGEAAWAALPEEEKLRIIAEREAMAAKLFEGLDVTNQDEDEDEDEDDNDEEDA